jgi:hypothetical protein
MPGLLAAMPLLLLAAPTVIGAKGVGAQRADPPTPFSTALTGIAMCECSMHTQTLS